MKVNTFQIHYVKVMREKLDRCNICRNQATLCWDHVPPKGGIEIMPVELMTILELLTAKYTQAISSISQNGVKFRTICQNCNNTRLGSRYDPVLNEFAIGVGKFLKTPLKIPPVINYETRPNPLIVCGLEPQMLVRAIVGHMLAAKSHFESTTIDEKLRDFFNDESADFPNDLKIFYWIYPYPYTVIIRDVVMPSVRGNFATMGCFSILKYFPLAYLLCNFDSYEGLDDLTFYYDTNPLTVSPISINLKQVRHPQWPEIVDDTNFLVGGQSLKSTVFAKPRDAGYLGR